MIRELIDNQSWWLLFIMTSVSLAFVTELGYRVGRSHPDDVVEIRKEQTGVLLTAILGLLGLLLAFSFSIAEMRFSARKALVLEQANAIRTTYLRTETLPEPHGGRIAELLRRYVAVRLGSRTPEALHRAITALEELHDELWTEAAAVARANPDSEIVSLFVASLNEVIEMHESRVTVLLYQRLPGPILMLLYAVALLAMGVLGVNSGLTRWRSPLPSAALILAVSSVIVLIVELDRPLGRIVRVSQGAMEQVQETIQKRHRPTVQVP